MEFDLVLYIVNVPYGHFRFEYIHIFLSANLFAAERLTLSLPRVLNFFQVVSDFRFH